TPENSSRSPPSPASPACSRKIQSAPPTALPAGSLSVIPLLCRPARCTATTTLQIPPTTSYIRSPGFPDSTASAPRSPLRIYAHGTPPLRTSALLAAHGPSATPTAPVSPPTAPSNTSAPPLTPLPPA